MTLNDEIFLAKQEKKLDQNVLALMESLEISDDSEEGLLNLKYCEVAELLKETDYDVFAKFKTEKDYSSITEACNIIKNAKSLIESSDLNVITSGYETLAKAKVVFESANINLNAKQFVEYLK